MPRFESDSEIRRLAEALAALRRERGLSQAEAGQYAGMTSQGWGLYESGKRPGLFRPDVQRRLTGAVDASPEDLALAVAREGAAPTPAPSGVENPGRSFQAAPLLQSAGIERMQLSNDDLAPWAASGVVLEFDAGRWPRRDQGCVIDLTDGTRLVRLYQRADGERLYVAGGPAGLDTETALDRTTVARVAAVRARLDE